MQRRDFLKGTGLLLLGLTPLMLPQFQTLVANALLGPEAELGSQRFRGARHGQILESLDGGKSWQPRVNFGEHCSVLQLFERGGQLYARLGVQGFGFYLSSKDGRAWYTVDRFSTRA